MGSCLVSSYEMNRAFQLLYSYYSTDELNLNWNGIWNFIRSELEEFSELNLKKKVSVFLRNNLEKLFWQEIRKNCLAKNMFWQIQNKKFS